MRGWGARIRTWGWRNQNPLPYHLATPQRAARLVGLGGKRADNSSGSSTPQWPQARFRLKTSRDRRRRERRALRLGVRVVCPSAKDSTVSRCRFVQTSASQSIASTVRLVARTSHSPCCAHYARGSIGLTSAPGTMGRRQIWSRFQRFQGLAAPFPSESLPALAASQLNIFIMFIRGAGSASRGETAAPTASESPLQFMPAAALCIDFNASSSVKVLGFWIGGKSLKVAAH
jgi:hypothetical protein